MKNIILLIFIIAGAFIIFTMIKSKRFFSAAFLTVIEGFVALVAANLLGGYIGIHLSINAFTIATSLVGGTPGVIMLLLLDTIFKMK
ncbi:MAG: pro-sigmaK processing inhibitor BofA family protein [Oscillospiraceae bacterium]